MSKSTDYSIHLNRLIKPEKNIISVDYDQSVVNEYQNNLYCKKEHVKFQRIMKKKIK